MSEWIKKDFDEEPYDIKSVSYVQFRNGEVDECLGVAHTYDWVSDGLGEDIVGYKRCVPDRTNEVGQANNPISDTKHWLINFTGECPPEPEGIIEVEFRNGLKVSSNASRKLDDYIWSVNGDEWDIMRYRRDAGLTCTKEGIVEFKGGTTSCVNPEGVNPKQSHGQASLPLSLFSPLGTAYGSLGKHNGMLKYGLSNFAATPVITSIYVDAIRRHLDKWMAGQECDSVDGVPHFAAILANVDIILCARAAGTLVDDRPLMKGYLEEVEKLTPLMKSLKELHKDKNPHHYLLKDV